MGWLSARQPVWPRIWQVCTATTVRKPRLWRALRRALRWTAAEEPLVILRPNGDMQERTSMKERHLHPSPDELQHQEFFTLEEAADVLLLGVNIVRHAVATGELPAQVVGHDIVAIHREDMLTWFLESEHADRRG